MKTLPLKISGDYERLIGATVVSPEILTPNAQRDPSGRRIAYLGCAASSGHLFIDPDTGLRQDSPARRCPLRRRHHYLFLDELTWLVGKRNENCLTVVYDQSVGRGNEDAHVKAKLRHLAQSRISAFAYRAHPCFIIAARNQDLIDFALVHFAKALPLPRRRLVSRHDL